MVPGYGFVYNVYRPDGTLLLKNATELGPVKEPGDVVLLDGAKVRVLQVAANTDDGETADYDIVVEPADE